MKFIQPCLSNASIVFDNMDCNYIIIKFDTDMYQISLGLDRVLATHVLVQLSPIILTLVKFITLT